MKIKLFILVFLMSFLNFAKAEKISLKAEDLDRSKDLLTYMESNIRKFSILLRKGANPNIKDEAGNSLLHLSINHKNTKVFKILIRSKADINVRDARGNTPLHLAVKKIRTFSTQSLVKNGADVNAVNELGQSPLHRASSSGTMIDNMKILIDEGADINKQDNSGKTPLYYAILNKEDRLRSFDRSVAYFLIKKGANVNLADKNGISPLMQALKLHRINLAKLLISQGADPSPVNQFIVKKFGKGFLNELPKDLNQKLELTFKKMHGIALLEGRDKKIEKIPFKGQVLFKAMEENDLRKFKSLLKSGANPNIKDEAGNSLFHLSIDHKNKRFFMALVKYKADPNIRNEKGNSPLHGVIKKMNLFFTQSLIENGADVNAVNELGQSPLHIASFYGQMGILKALIDGKADPNIQDQDGRSPLHIAILTRDDFSSKSNRSISKFLVKNGADVNLEDKKGISPFVEALKLHRIKTVKFLISEGADISRLNELGEDFLKELPEEINQRLEMIFKKMSRITLSERRDKKIEKIIFNEKDLLIAMEKNNLIKFRFLLRKGVNPNTKDEAGNSLLHLSLDHKNKRFFNVLIKYKADPNIRDARGNSPLHKAAKKMYTAFIQILIKNGADVNAVNELGQSPLHIVSSSGRMINNIKTLIDEGADINKQDNSGKTPLYYSILNKEDYFTRSVSGLLVEKGANVILADKNGISPLMQALKLHRIKLAKLFIYQGADASSINEFIKDQLGIDFLKTLPKDPYQKLELSFKKIRSLSSKQRGKKIEKIIFNEKDLFKLMEENNLIKFKFLLRKGVNPNIKDEAGNSLLHLSINHTNKRFFMALVKYKADPNIRDAKGNSPLHEAVKKMRTAFMRILIKNGADVNAVNELGLSPLHIASSSGRMINNMKILIDEGADINKQDNSGKTPLYYATLNKYDKYSKLEISVSYFLVKNGANPNLKDSDGISPLMQVLKLGRVKLARLFISHGADRSILNQFIISNFGEDFLKTLPKDPYQKLELSFKKILGLSLKKSRDEKIEKMNFKETDLLKLMEENNFLAFKQLLIQGADPNMKDEAGNSLLHLSIDRKNKNFFKALIEHNADISARDSKGNTPLHLASQIHKGFTKALVSKGADVNVKNEEGKTPLHLASSSGRVINNMKILIDEGADINKQDNSGKTPLYYATLNKEDRLRSFDRSVAYFLIKKGANVNLEDKNETSPLMQALKLHRINLAKFLISQGADASHLDHFIIHKMGEDFLKTLPKDPIQKIQGLFKSKKNQKKRRLIDVKKIEASDKDLFNKDLFKAMEEDNFRKFISLIKKGANPNVKDESGNSLLHRSIKHINKKFFQILIEHNADISARDSKGNTPLHLASQIHNGFTKALVSKGADVNAKNEEGKTPLHLASSSGLVINNIKMLIEAGAKINLKDSDGKTPLHLAISNKNDIKLANQSVARLLVESGADPNALDKRGVSPLMESINLHKISISRFLLTHGADILGFNQFIINNMGESFFNTLPVDPIEKLEVFIRKIYQENQGVERRVKKSPKASFTEKDLFKAMEENNLRKFSRILQKGLSPNAKDESGNSLLHLSLDHKNKGFFKALMEHDVDVNAKDGKGNTPLHKAVKKIRLVFTETLIKKGADPNAINESGQSPLHIASSSGRMINNIKILIEEKADINMQDNEGKTPLHLAILNKGDNISLSTKQSVAKFLIKNGAKLNTLDKDGISPFIQALKLERVNLSRILLSHGADVSKLDQFISDQFGTDFLNRLPKDLNQKLELTFRQINRLHQIRGKPKKEGENILFTEKDLLKLMEENNFLAFKQLLIQGADPNMKDEFGNSLLHLSIDRKNKNFFKALIEYKADLNIRDSEQNTPLHKTSQSFNGFTKTLIESGADVNAINEEGQSPLHIVSYSGSRISYAKALINAGADINPKDHYGKTPLHYASSNKHEKMKLANNSIAYLLVESGARLNVKDEKGRSPFMEVLELNRVNLADFFISKGAEVSDLNEFIKKELGEDFFKTLPEDPHEKLKLSFRKIHGIAISKDIPKDLRGTKYESLSEASGLKITPGFLFKDKKDKDSTKDKFLFKAMEENDLVKFKDLIENGADPNAKDENGNSLLHLSIEHQSTGFFMFLMSLLIKGDLNIEILDAEKNSPLHWAVLGSDSYYTKVLVDFMAKPNRQNEIGKTPLHFASSFGENNIKHMDILLENMHIKVNLQDEKGKTPLHYAVLSGSLNKVYLLVKKGADVNAKDLKGLSPLHELSQMKVSESMLKREMLSEILKLLIKKGANVNGLDDLKQSPLMKALEAGNKPIAESLIKYGAHLFAADKYGKAVLDFCLKDHLREFIKGELEKQTELNRSKAPNKTGLRPKIVSVRK